MNDYGDMVAAVTRNNDLVSSAVQALNLLRTRIIAAQPNPSAELKLLIDEMGQRDTELANAITAGVSYGPLPATDSTGLIDRNSPANTTFPRPDQPKYVDPAFVGPNVKTQNPNDIFDPRGTIPGTSGVPTNPAFSGPFPSQNPPVPTPGTSVRPFPDPSPLSPTPFAQATALSRRNPK